MSDLEVLHSTNEIGPIDAVADETEPKVEAAQSRVYRGLCVNCDVRETCAFPRPETGVWFCEEYQ